MGTVYHIHDIESTGRIPPVEMPAKATRLCVLGRYHGRPIGWVELPVAPGVAVLGATLTQAVREQLGWEIPRAWLTEHLALQDPERQRPPATVVVCTRDRPQLLTRGLQALLDLEYPAYEVLVVDNAPQTDETAQVAARLGVRYVLEDRPGLDWARNRGIAEARHKIIAFTDDDTRPDRGWLAALTEPFADPRVMAVTGLVAPAELETRAQILFETQYGGMGRGFRRRTVHGAILSTRELMWASAYGVGANMAFRREIFDTVGFFDVALDYGTASGGNGDNEMFHRLLAHGHTLVYEPAAIVWHTHRREVAALRRLMFDGGRSTGAYLLTCARNHTVPRCAILRFFLWEWLGWWLLRRLVRPRGFPRWLVVLELWGTLLSPVAYMVAQAEARQRAGQATASPVAAETRCPTL